MLTLANQLIKYVSYPEIHSSEPVNSVNTLRKHSLKSLLGYSLLPFCKHVVSGLDIKM